MLELWNKTSNIITPNGTEYTPEEIMTDMTTDIEKAISSGRKADEVKEEIALTGKAFLRNGWGFARYSDVVLEKQGKVTVGINDLNTLLQIYNLDENLTGQNALKSIIQVKEEQKIQMKESAAQFALLGSEENGAANLALIQSIAELTKRVEALETNKA